MTRIEADVDALKALRAALLRFGGRQTEALEAAAEEIQGTERLLEMAARHWAYQMDVRQERLHSCLREAAYAAAEGYRVDCSAQEAALLDAERHLARVIESQNRVREVVARYTVAAHRVSTSLGHDLPRATEYLAGRITALEAYHATRLLAGASAFAGAGVPGVIGGVIGAIRQSAGTLRRTMGAAGEQVAAGVLSTRFGLQELPFDQPAHGFDRVFHAPGMPLIILESKVSSDGRLHLGQTHAGAQGSPGWVAATAAAMVDRESAQWSPANERIAHLVQHLGADQVPVLAVVVEPAGGQTTVYARHDNGTWQSVDNDPPDSPASGPMMPPVQREGSMGGPERRG